MIGTRQEPACDSMKPRVYVETSVVSYLTARRSRDVVIAAYQEITQLLLDFGAVPHKAAADAAHIAIAVTNGVDYLVTWNFRHIANAKMRSRIERVCREAGYEPPTICTPNELMEPDHADETA